MCLSGANAFGKYHPFKLLAADGKRPGAKLAEVATVIFKGDEKRQEKITNFVHNIELTSARIIGERLFKLRHHPFLQELAPIIEQHFSPLWDALKRDADLRSRKRRGGDSTFELCTKRRRTKDTKESN